MRAVMSAVTSTRPVRAGLGLLVLLLAACPRGERPTPGERQPAAGTSDAGPATGFANPATPEAAAAEGMRLLRSGAPEAAEPHLTRALAAHPRDARLLEALGQIYARSNRFRQAETSFRQALEASPDSAGARLGLAKLLGDTGRDAEGIDVLAPLAKTRADVLPVRLEQARLLLKNGAAAEGLAAARAAAALDARSAEAQYLVGLGLEGTGDRAAALEAFERAAELDASHLGAWSHIQTLAARLGRQDESKRAAERHAAALLRSRVDERVRGHRVKAVEAFNRQDYPAALEEFQFIVREDPTDPQAQLFLGSSLLALNRRDEARVALERSLALDPRGERAWLEMGRLLAYENRLDEAMQALRKASEINPEFPEPHYFLAGILQARGEGEASRAEMRHFEDLRRRSPEGGMQVVNPQGSERR
jgi:tetratricopeptide (TPR) repeat protein